MKIKKYISKLRDKLLEKTYKKIDNINNIVNKKVNLNNRKTNEAIAMTQLMSLNPKTFFPITSWSIYPTVLNRILNDIIIYERKSIIEFGSGISTLFIALLAKRNNLTIHLTSIESDENWINIIKHLLVENKCEEYVSFKYVEIASTSLSIDSSPNKLWYDDITLNDLIDKNQSYDLIIVDGPQGSLCKNSRYPAIPFIKNNLADSFSVFLDDINRNDEKEIAKAWSQILDVPYSHFSDAALFMKKSEFSTQSFYDVIN